MMFIIGNFLDAIAWVLNLALNAYLLILIARALISWVNPDPWNPIVQFLHRATEPVLAPIRRRLHTWQWGVDFSPLVAILAIYFVQRFVVRTLVDLAGGVR
jgi:YggT family protein